MSITQSGFKWVIGKEKRSSMAAKSVSPGPGTYVHKSVCFDIEKPKFYIGSKLNEPKPAQRHLLQEELAVLLHENQARQLHDQHQGIRPGPRKLLGLPYRQACLSQIWLWIKHERDWRQVETRCAGPRQLQNTHLDRRCARLRDAEQRPVN